MNLLDRYFLREFLKPLVACLVAFLICMLVYDLFDNINDFIQAKTPFVSMFRYYFILIPAWLVQIMPITLLLSLLYVLSEMSKNGELTAMRASGLDFFRLMTPYLVIGTCFSLQMLSLNLGWAPYALYKAKQVFEETTQKRADDQDHKAQGVAYRNIQANRFWTIDMLDIDRGWARGIEVVVVDEHLKDQKRYSAANGYFTGEYWVLQNVIIYDYTQPITDPSVLSRAETLEMASFKENPKTMVVESRKTKRMTTRELLDALSASHRLSQKKRAELSTEFHYRIAYPVANFVVFLIGIPFGVVGQRKSNFLAVAYALLLFAGYTVLSQILFFLGQTGHLTPWIAAWLPNILFSGSGIWMIRNIR